MTGSVIALFTSQFEIKKQLEILLIISTKSVILTKNKNNNSSQIRTLVMSYFLDGTRLDLNKTKKMKPRINTGFSLVCPTRRIGVKNGFLGDFRKEQNAF